MDIHVPKAAHSWRDFLIEIGTIAIGILIALSLEQAVEAIHERRLAREANEAIDAEMQESVNRIGYRLSQQPCIDRRLGEVAEMLKDWREGTVPAAGLHIGDPGDVPLPDQRWQANLNSGRFSQQSPKEQSEQVVFYTMLEITNKVLELEHNTWSQLRTLELGPDQLSSDLRPAIVIALQSARTHADDLRQLGQQLTLLGKQAGVKPTPYRGPVVGVSTCQPLQALHGR